MTMSIGIAAAACVALLLAMRYWSQLNSSDLGFMSQQWLDQYNAQNP